MTMSRVDEEVGDQPRDNYEPIKRLAMVQIQPPRNPSKPFTSFGIKDILGPIHPPGNHDTPTKEKKLRDTEDGDNGQSLENSQHKQCHVLSCCLGNQMRSLKRSLCLTPSPSLSENLDKDSPGSQQDVEDRATKRLARSHSKDLSIKNDSPNSEYNFLHDSKLQEPSKPEAFRDSEGEHRIPVPDLPTSPAQLGLCSPPLDGRRFPPGGNRPRSVLSEEFPSPVWNHEDIPKPVNLSTTRIVRPWDSDAAQLSPPAKQQLHQNLSGIFTPTPGAILTASEASSDEEEISVDDDEPPSRRSLFAGLTNRNGRSGPMGANNVKNISCNRTSVSSSSSSNRKKLQSVSPLDALMAMTSKTFEGLETTGSSEAKRRDQSAIFGKHQPPKKRRKSRTAFTNQQIYELEKRFLYQKYLTPADRDEIAASLGLTNAQVITWFQNRRAKLKRDLEELKNDVTAAKKFPSHKSGTGAGGGTVMSLAELELRRVQEKTLRDSFNNGGLQSPSSSSLTSMTSEDGPERAASPLRSPAHLTASSEADDISAMSGRSDTPRKLSDNDVENTENNIREDDIPSDLSRVGRESNCAADTVSKKSLDKPKSDVKNVSYRLSQGQENFLDCPDRDIEESQKET